MFGTIASPAPTPKSALSCAFEVPGYPSTWRLNQVPLPAGFQKFKSRSGDEPDGVVNPLEDENVAPLSRVAMKMLWAFDRFAPSTGWTHEDRLLVHAIIIPPS